MYNNQIAGYQSFFYGNVANPVRMQGGCINPFIQPGGPRPSGGIVYYTIG